MFLEMLLRFSLLENPCQSPKRCFKSKVLLSGSTLVPTTVLVMESARLVTQPPAECTANATNTGKGKLATSLTVGTTAGAPTTATATSLGRSCASATTVGKVGGNCTNQHDENKKTDVFMDASCTIGKYLFEAVGNHVIVS